MKKEKISDIDQIPSGVRDILLLPPFSSTILVLHLQYFHYVCHPKRLKGAILKDHGGFYLQPYFFMKTRTLRCQNEMAEFLVES